MSVAVAVRAVRPDDAQSLHANCLSGWTLEQVREAVAASARASEQVTLVAIADGMVVGTASLRRRQHRMQRHRAEFEGVVVYPPYQRRGVARRLLEEARRRAAALGVAVLESSTRGGTEAETALRRLGFREYGRLPGGFVDEGRVFDHVLLYAPVAGDAEPARRRAPADR
jgi:GNAT superfamily N-acetyltransferase